MLKNKRTRKITGIILALLLVAGQFLNARPGVQAAGRKISLNNKKITLSVGQSKRLKVSNANGKKVKWSSSKKSVASVNKKGLVKAKKAGKAVITANVSGKKLKCRVVVNKASAKPSNTQAPAQQVTQVPQVTPEATKTPEQKPETAPTPVVPAVTQEPETTTVPETTAVPETTQTPVLPTQEPVTSTPAPVVTQTPVIQGPVAPVIPVVPSAPTQAPQITPSATVTPAAATQTPAVTQEPAATQTPDIASPETGRILVAYFSWSGTSERIAQNIIEQTGADSFRIERETPYSTNYNEVAYGEAQTEAETNARPPIKDPLQSVAQYDKIVLCYPIWWHTAPMTVGTFLESYDFTGKTIYPVSQSASMSRQQYEESVTFIKGCAKGAIVDDGLFLKDNTEIKNYISEKVLP